MLVDRTDLTRGENVHPRQPLDEPHPSPSDRTPSRLARTGELLFRKRTLLGVAQVGLVGLAVATYPADAPVPSMRLALGLLLTGTGLFLRAWVAGTTPAKTSGRLVHRQQARTLNTTGAYSVMRHPLYLANLLVLVGVAVRVPSPWLAPAMTVFFAMSMVPILVAEEAFLSRRFGPVHAAWAARTPRLLPRPYRYRPAVLPGSMRTALRRETSTWLGAVLVHALLTVGLAARTAGDPIPWAGTVVAVGGMALVASVVKLLKYRTRLLHVTGR